MMRWTTILAVATLAGILSLSLAETARLDGGQETRQNDHFRGNLAEVLGAPKGRNGGDEAQGRKKGHVQTKDGSLGKNIRDQLTKSLKEMRSQRTKFPLEKTEQRVIAPPVTIGEVDAGRCSASSYSSSYVQPGDTRVQFSSPHFPSSYPSNVQHGTKLYTDRDYQVVVSCDEADIVGGDYLVFEGVDGGGIAVFTDQHSAIGTFATGESEVRVTFCSDSSSNARGYQCRASSTLKQTASTTTPSPTTTPPPIIANPRLGGSTTTQPRSTTTQPRSTTTQAGSTTTQLRSTTTQAGSTTTQPRSTTTQAGSTTTQAGSTTAQAGSTTTQAGSTTTQAGSTTTQDESCSMQAGSTTTRTPTTTTRTPTTTTRTPTTTTRTPAITTRTPTTTSSPPRVCVCGKKQLSLSPGRIVGGQNTSPNEYPWMVGLVFYNIFRRSWINYCGGALISSRWILTAGRCVRIFSFVMLGQHDLSSSNTGRDKRAIRQVVRRSFLQSVFSSQDIALLRIDPVNFAAEPTIRPICLPDDPTEDYAGDDATITGWGLTSEGGREASILRAVEVPVISNSQCSSKYGFFRINKMMLCAGSSSGGKDFCNRDTGGPLIVADGNNYELIGIASWHTGCGRSRYPGVYTRVTAYLDWIKSVTGSDVCPRS